MHRPMRPLLRLLKIQKTSPNARTVVGHLGQSQGQQPICAGLWFVSGVDVTIAEVDLFRMINTRIERQHIESRIDETQGLIDDLDIQLEEIRTDPSAAKSDTPGNRTTCTRPKKTFTFL